MADRRALREGGEKLADGSEDRKDITRERQKERNGLNSVQEKGETYVNASIYSPLQSMLLKDSNIHF